MFFSTVFYIDSKRRGIWTINPVFRLVMFVILAVTAASLLLFSAEEAPLPFLQYLFAAAAAAGFLYRDCCLFDTKTKRVTHKIGFAFFVKKRSWSFDEIGSLRLAHLYRGKKLFEIQCGLRSKSGELLADIEHVKKREKDVLERRAQQAASLIGCPVEYGDL